MRFGCLLFLLPFIEIALLIQVARWIGAWEVVGLVAGTAILAILIARIEAARSLAAIRGEIARGGIPSRSIVDSASILIGCVCLAVPGFLTDLLGILLLLPLSRRHLYRWIQGVLVAGAARGGVRIMTWGSGAQGGWTGAGGSGFGGFPGAGQGEGGATEIPGGEGSAPQRPPRPGEIIQ